MMKEDLINAIRMLFSRDPAYTLEDLMKQCSAPRQQRLPDLGHIVVHWPLPIFSESGQFALFGFNRDHQIVAIQYRMLHDAKWSAEAEYNTAEPLLQAKCGGSARRYHDWERWDRLEAQTCTWKMSRYETVTLRREQLKLKSPQRMVSITRRFEQPAAAANVTRGLEDLFC